LGQLDARSLARAAAVLKIVVSGWLTPRGLRPQSMMPKSAKRFSDNIMLQLNSIDHVYDFGSVDLKSS
jgi:hypothetical protein